MHKSSLPTSAGDSIECNDRNREKRLLSLLNTCGQGLFEWNVETDSFWFSVEWKLHLGYTDTEFSNELSSWHDRVHPEDRNELFRALEGLPKLAENRFDTEYRVLHRDGSWRWMSLIAHHEKSSSTKHGIVTGIQFEITHRKAADEEIRKSFERTRHAIDATRDGIWDWDIATGDVYFSPQWARLLGFEPDEVPGRVEFFFTILHPDEVERVGKIIEDHLAGLTPVKQDEVRLRMKSGEYRWFLDRGKVVSRDVDGKPLRMAGTITDITEKKKTERTIQTYASLANDLNRSNSVRDASRFIATAADNLIGWDAAVLVMFDDVQETRYSVLNIDLIDGIRQEVHVSPTEERLAYRVKETRNQGAHLVLRHDPEELADYINSAGEMCRASASLMFVPIRDGDLVVGILSIQSYAKDAFDNQDLETLQILADYCGGAISRILSRIALKESESWLREAQSISHIGNFRWDAKSGHLIWSAELYRIYGQNPDSFKPSFESYVSFIHLEDRQQIVESLRKVMQSGGRFSHDYRIVLNDGTMKWVGARGIALLNNKGEFIGLEGTCQDITELKNSEVVLRSSEKKFRTLFENSGDAIFLMSDRLFHDCNAKTLQMFGCQHREQILGKSPAAFSPQFQADGRLSDWQANAKMEAAERGEPQFFEWIHTKLDGVPFFAEVSLNLLDLGDRRYLQAIVRDVTERKKLEEQLRQSHKMEAIGLLAGGVAHDFNNLLTVINGFCDILISQHGDKTPASEQLIAIRDAGEKAADLTSQLLAFSRKAIVEPKVLDLNERIESTFRMLRRLIGSHIRLETELDQSLDRIRIDPTQLDQVVMNLAVNAHDAMPRGGVFKIATENIKLSIDGEPTSYVELVVSDSGEGMPAEVRDRVFEPFFTTKGLGKGTGLGLATVHGIVSQAGGNITVESELGVGTTFRIRFPAVTEKSKLIQPTIEKGVGPRGAETVLLAEDEPAVRRLACLALEMQGYTVLHAESGPKALAISRAYEGKIDLLVTDVVMPEKGGRDLAEEIRQLRPGIRVLFVSGYSDDEIFRHGVERSTAAFLQKPFTTRALASKVREVLDQVR